MDGLVVYYESKTGNVLRFINKIKELVSEQVTFIRLGDGVEVVDKGHLITYTTRVGQVPDITKDFLKTYHDKVVSVSSSGNMNWGKNYGLSLDKIVGEYPNIVKGMKFELSGTNEDIETYMSEILKFKITNEY